MVRFPRCQMLGLPRHAGCLRDRPSQKQSWSSSRFGPHLPTACRPSPLRWGVGGGGSGPPRRAGVWPRPGLRMEEEEGRRRRCGDYRFYQMCCFCVNRSESGVCVRARARARACVCRLRTGLRFYWMLSQDSSFNLSPSRDQLNATSPRIQRGQASQPPPPQSSIVSCTRIGGGARRHQRTANCSWTIALS